MNRIRIKKLDNQTWIEILYFCQKHASYFSLEIYESKEANEVRGFILKNLVKAKEEEITGRFGKWKRVHYKCDQDSLNLVLIGTVNLYQQPFGSFLFRDDEVRDIIFYNKTGEKIVETVTQEGMIILNLNEKEITDLSGHVDFERI